MRQGSELGVKKVSVVIPVYNGEDYLNECLNSVEKQTHPPFEVIVINDGSTDRSKKIARQYDCRIISFEENRGIGFARHVGAEEARGDYVAFLSADDAYLNRFLELMSHFASSFPNHIVFSDYYRCDDRLYPTQVAYAPATFGDEEFRRVVVEYALRQSMFVNFSTLMIPKGAFSGVQFDQSLRFGEDLIFLLETLLHDISWFHVPIPLVHYRVHGQAGTFKGWTYQNWLNLWIKLAPLLQRLGVPQQAVNNATRRAYWSRFHPLKKIIKLANKTSPEFWSATKRVSILRHGWQTAKKIVSV